jgi:hypothetical protein
MKHFLSIFIAAFVFISCKKNQESPPKTDLTLLSLKEQREYQVANFKVLGSEIAKAAQDPAVRRIIEDEALKKFDGDYNVLIKDLLKYPEFASKVNIERLQKGLDAFKNIAGNNYYPQIYIPRLSKDISPNSNNSNTIESEDLEFILYNGDETQHTFPAYEYDGADSLILAGFDIDEYYAMYHNVYVISTNETVNNNGYVPPTPNQPDSTPPQPNSINVQINKMTVLHHKESWVAGKSDVHMQAYRYTWNGFFNGGSSPPIQTELSDRTAYNTYGHQIRRFSRSEINNKTEVTLNYYLQRNWLISDPFPKPIIYYFVIFEKDNWPAAVRVTQTHPMWVHKPTEDQVFLQFRSSDNEYWVESFYATFGWFSNLQPVVNYLANPDNIYENNVVKELKRKENNSYQGIRFNINRY